VQVKIAVYLKENVLPVDFSLHRIRKHGTGAFSASAAEAEPNTSPFHSAGRALSKLLPGFHQCTGNEGD